MHAVFTYHIILFLSLDMMYDTQKTQTRKQKYLKMYKEGRPKSMRTRYRDVNIIGRSVR